MSVRPSLRSHASKPAPCNSYLHRAVAGKHPPRAKRWNCRCCPQVTRIPPRGPLPCQHRRSCPPATGGMAPQPLPGQSVWLHTCTGIVLPRVVVSSRSETARIETGSRLGSGQRSHGVAPAKRGAWLVVATPDHLAKSQRNLITNMTEAVIHASPTRLLAFEGVWQREERRRRRLLVAIATKQEHSTRRFVLALYECFASTGLLY